MRRRRGRTTSRAVPLPQPCPGLFQPPLGPWPASGASLSGLGNNPCSHSPSVHTGSMEEALLTEAWAAECCDTEPHRSGARGPRETHFSAAIQLPSWYLGPGSDPARSYSFLPGCLWARSTDSLSLGVPLCETSPGAAGAQSPVLRCSRVIHTIRPPPTGGGGQAPASPVCVPERDVLHVTCAHTMLIRVTKLTKPGNSSFWLLDTPQHSLGGHLCGALPASPPCLIDLVIGMHTEPQQSPRGGGRAGRT